MGDAEVVKDLIGGVLSVKRAEEADGGALGGVCISGENSGLVEKICSAVEAEVGVPVEVGGCRKGWYNIDVDCYLESCAESFY